MERTDMMYDMMCGEMMWGMGLFSLLALVVLVLAAAALVKYLFSSSRTDAAPQSKNNA